MPDFATFRDFAMPENSGIFRRNFPLEKMPPNPAQGGGDTFAYLPFPPDYGPVIKRMNIRLHSFPIKGRSSIQSAK